MSKKKKNEDPVEENGNGDRIEVQEPGEPKMAPEGPTTTNGVTALPFDTVELLVEEIMPDPLNPNVETPATFNTLVSTISEDGFDQPVVVCPIDDQERAALKAGPEVKYVLAKGEHRWRAARVLGHKTIPAVIRPWDPLTRRTRLVRDNTVKGELDKEKFTELVHSLQAEHSLDSELASTLLGFDSSKEMYGHMVRDGGAKKNLEDTAALDQSKSDLKVLDDLTLVLNTLFTRYGHTLPIGFIAFMWGGKINTMVEMDEALTDPWEKLKQLCVDRKVDISIMLASIIRDGLPTGGAYTPSEQRIQELTTEVESLKAKLEYQEQPRDPEQWPCSFGHHDHATREEAVECVRKRQQEAGVGPEP